MRNALRAVPTVGWVLAAITAVVLVALDVRIVLDHGVDWFFRAGDPVFSQAVARAPFGSGHAVPFLGDPGEAPYRYGRIGMPFAAWVLGVGRPGAITWTLLLLHHGAFVALPVLAATLLDKHGAPAFGGAVVVVIPGLVAIYDRPYVEVVLAALLLSTVLAAKTRRFSWAWCFLTFAILTKETAALAIVPMVWFSLRNRHPRQAALWCTTVVPYFAWATWVRFRVGEFPFLAPTNSRTGALALPGVGVREVLADKSSTLQIAVLVIGTVVVGVAAAWIARPSLLSGYAAAFGLFAACAGPNTLRYPGETLRVLAIPQMFAALCVVVGMWGTRRAAADGSNVALSGSNTYL